MTPTSVIPLPPFRPEKLSVNVQSPVTVTTLEQKILSAGNGIAKRLVQNVGSAAAYLRLGFSQKSVRDDLIAWYNFEANGSNSVVGGAAMTEAGTAAYGAGKVGDAVTLTAGDIAILYNGGDGLAYSALPAWAAGNYSIYLSAVSGTFPVVDLSWWAGDVYATCGTSTTLAVVEATGVDRLP